MIAIRSDNHPSDKQRVTAAPSSHGVSRPIPASQAADPRTYQLAQLRKRFSGPSHRFRETSVPSTGGLPASTAVSFRLPPSDPDFPFDLSYLEIEIRVPASHPGADKEGGDGEDGADSPTLKASGPGLPRGFCVNVERGWDGLVRKARQRDEGVNLLWLVNTLDRNLEKFLAEKQADAAELVVSRDARHLEKQGADGREPKPQGPRQRQQQPQRPRATAAPGESYSRERILAARARRALETRQIETRMSRLPGYARAADGVVYTLPLEPGQQAQLPEGLRGVRSVNLIVPLLYPLQSPCVQLGGAGIDAQAAEGVESLFEEKVAETKTSASASGEGGAFSLTGWVNYLARNLHRLAREAKGSPEVRDREATEESVQGDAGGRDSPAKPTGRAHEDKGHIRFIPRPREWAVINELGDGGEAGEDDDNDDDDDDDDSDSIYGDNDGHGPNPASTSSTTTTTTTHGPAIPAEHATTIAFPAISLLGIDLLDLTVLGVSVKCDRCRTLNEVTGLADLHQKRTACRKCTKGLAVAFRKDLIHQGSVCAGSVELAGCTVADVLTSTFVPTCARCDSPAGDFSTVPGERLTNVCRGCHARITLALPAPRFVASSPGDPSAVIPCPSSSSSSSSGGGPRAAAAAGPAGSLRGGEPLPDRGACAHYRQSFRWFRFSCCGRVYACDRCHDRAEDHPNEWAARMVCGWCSREQRFAAEQCRFCGRSVVGRGAGTGFWEGGRGTRNRRLMNRKDTKKFKRVGGGATAAEAARKKGG